MVTVRVVTATDSQKPVSMRDSNFDTKRAALMFIERLGVILSIRKIYAPNRIYIVTPKRK